MDIEQLEGRADAAPVALVESRRLLPLPWGWQVGIDLDRLAFEPPGSLTLSLALRASLVCQVLHLGLRLSDTGRKRLWGWEWEQHVLLQRTRDAHLGRWDFLSWDGDGHVEDGETQRIPVRLRRVIVHGESGGLGWWLHLGNHDGRKQSHQLPRYESADFSCNDFVHVGTIHRDGDVLVPERVRHRGCQRGGRNQRHGCEQLPLCSIASSMTSFIIRIFPPIEYPHSLRSEFTLYQIAGNVR